MKAVKHNQYGWILAPIIAMALVVPGTANALGGDDFIFNTMKSYADQVANDAEPRDDYDDNEGGGDDSEAKAVPAPAVLPLMGIGLAGLWVSGYLTRRRRSQR